jgi:phospholipid/cholesterol/gamma-HCH transport system substrate-binding protein
MILTRQILIQMAIFVMVALTALAIMVFGYMRLPEMLGVGQYRVTVELPETGGLYPRGNVTYRGAQVGTVDSVHLTDSGVAAVLSLDSKVTIPADVKAEVHSVSAVGEQYVQLVPRSGAGPALKDGDVIPQDRTTVPTDINAVLADTTRGLQVIPHDNLKTVIDEAYVAVGGLGPELRRLVNGSTQLAIDARKNLDPLTTLIDQSKPVLDSQAETAGSIQAWASNLASITGQLQSQDTAVAGILDKGPGAADEVHGRLPRLQPQPESAAAVHHWIPARPAAAVANLPGLPRQAGGGCLLPGPAGRAVQCARRPQPALRDGAGQTRPDGEAV